jgi:hypothetical protein
MRSLYDNTMGMYLGRLALLSQGKNGNVMSCYESASKAKDVWIGAGTLYGIRIIEFEFSGQFINHDYRPRAKRVKNARCVVRLKKWKNLPPFKCYRIAGSRSAIEVYGDKPLSFDSLDEAVCFLKSFNKMTEAEWLWATVGHSLLENIN